MFSVLVLSRSYPNSQMELLGLWVERLVARSQEFCRPVAISPVPYCPPLPGLPETYAKFRRVERRGRREGVDVYYPRFLVGPGYSLFRWEWMLYYAGILRTAERLHRQAPFDLIHAHFTYPDGVAAARLGRRFGVPVVVTEHVPWDGWLEKHPEVAGMAARVAREAAFHVSVSESVRKSVERAVGPRENLVVIPNGVDGEVFSAEGNEGKAAHQILFAGAVRPVKGVDVLLRAMSVLAARGSEATLVIAGEAFYGAYQKEEERLKGMVSELGLASRVRFVGKKSPVELAALMRQSAALVLPSRAESFGMALVEALACGIPVVATRCGGPEDIVTDAVGVLAPVEDAEALADGIARVLERRGDYRPDRLRAYALENFSLESVAHRFRDLYERAVKR